VPHYRSRLLVPSLALALVLPLLAAPSAAQAEDAPLFTHRLDLLGRPPSVPFPLVGFGVMGFVQESFKLGGSGFIAPSPFGPYLGGELAIGGLRKIPSVPIRLGGEGTVGVFGVPGPLLAFIGPHFGGFFEFLATPPTWVDVHVGFRFGARVFLGFGEGGYPVGFSVTPAFAVNFYWGAIGGDAEEGF